MLPLLGGLHHHQHFQYLDSSCDGNRRTAESVCVGWQCSYPGSNFTLAPDDKYIKYTMEKAMYLIDETGLAQYNTLKEKGFYSNIMGTSAVFSIFCDSIKFDKDKMEFTYYGRQRIERRSSILTRELVTAGQIKRVPRTDNNPHGLLITNWRTLLNKDIEQKTKMLY